VESSCSVIVQGRARSYASNVLSYFRELVVLRWANRALVEAGVPPSDPVLWEDAGHDLSRALGQANDLLARIAAVRVVLELPISGSA
jgi:hypothetical protein